MTRTNLLLLLCVPVFLCAAADASALDLGGHDRDGMVLGLDLGYGWNGVDYDLGELSVEHDVEAFTGGFKIGWARSDKLVGFIGLSGWKRSYNVGVPATATNFNFAAEVYWYPTGQGFWAKGGLGAGSLDLYVNTVLTENRIDEKGSGLLTTLGVGYEFRVSGTAAFGFAYDYTRVDVGDLGPAADAVTENHVFAMTLRWYQD